MKRTSHANNRAAQGTKFLPRLVPTLASIVAPLEVERFLKLHWKKTVFHCRGNAGRLQGLLRALGTTDVKALLARSRRYAVLGKHIDESSATRLSVSEAVKAYDKRGATLYFSLGAESPLGKWTAAIAEELGEPPIGVTSLFAVRNRNGTKPHFDRNENFTIQIRGAKRWLVAPNHLVTHPVANWEMGMPAPPYTRSPQIPGKMPADAKVYLLTPGSVLYVPRGYLHQVTSVDDADSLSLNICLPPTPWATILCTLLSNRLLETPEFRDSLKGVFGRGWGRVDFFKQLPHMMRAFRRNAQALDDDVRDIVDDRRKLEEYLIRRRHPII